MTDDAAPSPDPEFRGPVRLGVSLWVRLSIVGSSLAVVALLAHRASPPQVYEAVPHIPVVTQGFAAWSVGFIVMAVATTVIAGAHSIDRMNAIGAILVAFGALMLFPIVHGTSEFLQNDLSDITTGFMYLIPSALAAILTIIGLAVSRLVSTLRFLVLISGSVVGAFAVSGLWERRVFDGLNLVVVIAVGLAVAVAVIALTVWTPDNRPSRETTVDRSEVAKLFPEIWPGEEEAQ